MRLVDARVIGFQSFDDTGVIEFQPGINLLVGQNNAGKSALLRALQASILDDRHRTPAEWLDGALPVPVTEFSFEAEEAEILQAVFERKSATVIPAEGQDPEQYVRAMFGSGAVPCFVSRLAGELFHSVYPSHRKFRSENGARKIGARLFPRAGSVAIEAHNNDQDTLPELYYHLWQTKMFYFSAERLSVGETANEYVGRLTPTASNLAAVLATLAGERGNVFRKLVAHLSEIFSTVGNLSVRPKPSQSNTIEIRVWPTVDQDRVELSFPLNQSGTGVAQTIAILTAVMTMETSVIMIDEINSFLHPSAVKALLRILQTEYAQHQYIISTHAPEVIGFSNPSTIHLVKRDGYNSTVQPLDIGEIGTLREVAGHLGVSMADVFAADQVIWVEGETEETMFPFLHRNAIGPLPSGTIFTAVVATGDFGAKRRDKTLVYQAYSRLSASVATLPVRVAFGFDTELLSDTEKAEMVRDSGGRLHFLPRRHLECYLLDPEAIATRIAQKDPAATCDGAAITQMMQDLACKQSYVQEKASVEISDPEWLAKVDAAKLLGTIFSKASDARIEYDKTTDGIEILKIILRDRPDNLTELIAYVASLVGAVQDG